jgi:hypothetical protein
MSPVQKHFISMRRLNRTMLGQKSIIGDNLRKAGWSWACVSAIDSNGRTIWIADAQDGDGKRFVVRADEKLTAFVQLGIGGCTYWSLVIFSISLLCLSLSFVILSTLFLSFVPS